MSRPGGSITGLTDTAADLDWTASAASRAERMAHNEEFYIPVVIDDAPLSISREPRVFHQIQATPLPGGAITPAFAERLLAEQHVAVLAGTAFGPGGTGHLRLCYATAPSELERALGAIRQFVGALTPVPA